MKYVLYYRGYGQALFFIGLVTYVWYFPPADFFDETWSDTWTDGVGVACLLLGELLRVWAASHAKRCTRWRDIKARVLITTGPYAYIRHPIYVGNFLIGLGMIVLAEAFIFVPPFLVLFTFYYRTIVSAEETFLKESFGSEFDLYCRLVPKYIPRVMPRKFSLGRNFPLKELGTACVIIISALFLKWIESPLHRLWIVGLWYWIEAIVR
ncbi:MAG TPA: isoprenylcysteine carboxylmethyltransferase family protein [Candidatus Binatia bacterium]